ncbi:hypothetical protein HG531_013753 [Fusarium graminearum]|nr:hypothetical protein HG531_013753 [Fusarium graminearum]
MKLRIKFPSAKLQTKILSSTINKSEELVGLDRTLSNSGRDNSAHTLLQSGSKSSIELNAGPGAGSTLLETTDTLESLVESANDDISVLLLVVDNTVGAGIESVSSNSSANLLVDALNSPDGSAGDVVHVEDGRVGVGAGSVERVGLAHGDLGKLGEILVLDGLLHESHVGGDNVCYSLLEEARGSNGLLHARGRGNALLGGAGNEDQSSHLGPVGRRVRELVEKGDGLNQSGETGSGRSKAGGSGEVVLGDDLQGVGRKLGEGRIGLLESGTARSKLTEASLGSGARDVGGLSVESEAVAIGKGARA